MQRSESTTTRLSDVVSRIVVDIKDPGEEAAYIIKACQNAEVVQKNWR